MSSLYIRYLNNVHVVGGGTMRNTIADLKMLLVLKIQNLWRLQRKISLIQSFLLTLQKNIKKEVKKFTEMSDSKVDFLLNKIVIHRFF